MNPVAEISKALVCVIDDDVDMRGAISSLLRSAGYRVETFANPDEFLASDLLESAACLLLDVRMGSTNGLDFQRELLDSQVRIPVILMSGYGDVPMTVRAMRAGAITFLAKPFSDDELLVAAGEAVECHWRWRSDAREAASLRTRYERLTPRERDVLALVVAGLMNKQVAARLALSEITVKIHCGNLMRKMEAQSLADLVRMAEGLGVRATASRFGR